MPEKEHKRARRNNRIRIGDRVEVARDIFRIPDPKSAEERDAFGYRRVQHSTALRRGVPTCAPPCSIPSLYAKAGEQGKVLSFVLAWGRESQPQVQMDDGEIKTFRSTSLRLA